MCITNNSICETTGCFMTGCAFAYSTPTTWIFHRTADFPNLTHSCRLNSSIFSIMKPSLLLLFPGIFHFSLFLFYLISVALTQDLLSTYFFITLKLFLSYIQFGVPHRHLKQSECRIILLWRSL